MLGLLHLSKRCYWWPQDITTERWIWDARLITLLIGIFRKKYFSAITADALVPCVILTSTTMATHTSSLFSIWNDFNYSCHRCADWSHDKNADIFICSPKTILRIRVETISIGDPRWFVLSYSLNTKRKFWTLMYIFHRLQIRHSVLQKMTKLLPVGVGVPCGVTLTNS